MTVKKCLARRPNGARCTEAVPPGNRAFCARCDGEVFKTKPRFTIELPDIDPPNTYEPEPVEIPFNEKEERHDPLA